MSNHFRIVCILRLDDPSFTGREWDFVKSFRSFPSNAGLFLRLHVGIASAGTDDRRFQLIHGSLALIESRHRIDVQIHTQSVAQLIGDQLGINARLAGQTRMRAPHNLKRRPLQADGFQARPNPPAPDTVAP